MRKLKDAFWPSTTPLSSEEIKRERQRVADDTAQLERAIGGLTGEETELKDMLSFSAKALDEENARKASVEARLLNIAGLLSIAGTVVLGTLVTIARDATPLPGRGMVTAAIAVCCVYLTVQLALAIHASIIGLRLMGYIDSRPFELIPEPSEGRVAFMRRRIQENLSRLDEHRSTNNRKASQLGVAYCAVRNVLVGLPVLAIVAFAGIYADRGSRPPTPTLQAPTANLPSTTAVAVPRLQLVRIAAIGPFGAATSTALQFDADRVRSCVQQAISSAELGRVLQWQVIGRVPESRSMARGRATPILSSIAMERALNVATALTGPGAPLRPERAFLSVGVTVTADQPQAGVDLVALVDSGGIAAPLMASANCALK